MSLLHQAAWERPDLVCLPETFTGLGMSTEKWIVTAEPLEGETVALLSDYARRHQTWVICPMVLDEGGKLFNTAVLINRQADAELEVAQPEARCLLTCHRSDQSVRDWVREFRLEPIAAYFDRARRERAQRLCLPR